MTNKHPVGFVESNGRLFAQAVYKGNIQWLDTSISIANNKFGTGVFIWDYSFHELGFIDLNLESSEDGQKHTARLLKQTDIFGQ